MVCKYGKTLLSIALLGALFSFATFFALEKWEEHKFTMLLEQETRQQAHHIHHLMNEGKNAEDALRSSIASHKIPRGIKLVLTIGGGQQYIHETRTNSAINFGQKTVATIGDIELVGYPTYKLMSDHKTLIPYAAGIIILAGFALLAWTAKENIEKACLAATNEKAEKALEEARGANANLEDALIEVRKSSNEIETALGKYIEITGRIALFSGLGNALHSIDTYRKDFLIEAIKRIFLFVEQNSGKGVIFMLEEGGLISKAKIGIEQAETDNCLLNCAHAISNKKESFNCQKHCYYCIPIVCEDTVIGVLYLEMKQDSSPAVMDAFLVPIIGETLGAIIEKKKLTDELDKQASFDKLTNLPNRRTFDKILLIAYGDVKRHGAMIALVALDLDYFKKINDTYGHETGDEILRVVARKLSEHIRGSDIISRRGGDEFTCILRGFAKSRLALRKKIEDMINAVSEPINIGDGICARIGMSAGGIFIDGGLSLKANLEKADDLLYRAKKERGVFVFGE